MRKLSILVLLILAGKFIFSQKPRIAFSKRARLKCEMRPIAELEKIIKNFTNLDSAYIEMLKYFNSSKGDAFVLLCYDCPGFKSKQFPSINQGYDFKNDHGLTNTQKNSAAIAAVPAGLKNNRNATALEMPGWGFYLGDNYNDKEREYLTFDKTKSDSYILINTGFIIPVSRKPNGSLEELYRFRLEGFDSSFKIPDRKISDSLSSLVLDRRTLENIFGFDDLTEIIIHVFSTVPYSNTETPKGKIILAGNVLKRRLARYAVSAKDTLTAENSHNALADYIESLYGDLTIIGLPSVWQPQ